MYKENTGRRSGGPGSGRRGCFFRGTAETSGLTAEQLYVTNAVERMAGLPKCSFAAVWGNYAKDRMVAGRNYDYGKIFAELEDDVLVTVFNPADGSLSTAIVGYAGEIYAVNGMNEAGIFLELNNGKASAPMKAPDERITGTTLLLDVLLRPIPWSFWTVISIRQTAARPISSTCWTERGPAPTSGVPSA